MSRHRRADRLSELLKQEISLLAQRELRDPRIGTATITAVQASPELDHARVYVTALGDRAEKEAAAAGLNSAASFIRGELGRRLRLRRVPELHFTVDEQLEEAMRIERLLREVSPGDPDGEGDGEEKGGDSGRA